MLHRSDILLPMPAPEAPSPRSATHLRCHAFARALDTGEGAAVDCPPTASAPLLRARDRSHCPTPVSASCSRSILIRRPSSLHCTRPQTVSLCRCPAAGESVSRSAASFAKGSAPSARCSTPFAWSCLWPSAIWTAGNTLGEASFGRPSLAFSGLLVQTLVQTGRCVAITPCETLFRFRQARRYKAEVGGSSPSSPIAPNRLKTLVFRGKARVFGFLGTSLGFPYLARNYHR